MSWDIHFHSDCQKYQVFSTVSMGYVSKPMNTLECFNFLVKNDYAGKTLTQEVQDLIIHNMSLAHDYGTDEWRPYPDQQSYRAKNVSKYPKWIQEGVEREDRRTNPAKYNTNGAGI